jgi:hypothetical protein
VDGVWKLEADPAAIAALPCALPAAASPQDAIAHTNTQSGKDLVLGVPGAPKATASGLIEGNNVRAWGAPFVQYSAQTGCSPNVRLGLSSMVDVNANPRTMAGKLWIQDCPNCATVEFRATRQSITPKTEPSH